MQMILDEHIVEDQVVDMALMGWNINQRTSAGPFPDSCQAHHIHIQPFEDLLPEPT